MTRCDNDECPLSSQCTRFLLYPQEGDGVQRYEPRITAKYDELLKGAEIMDEHIPMIRTECDYFIELSDPQENYN